MLYLCYSPTHAGLDRFGVTLDRCRGLDRCRVGQARVGQIRVGQIRVGQARVGQIRVGQRLDTSVQVVGVVHKLYTRLVGLLCAGLADDPGLVVPPPRQGCHHLRPPRPLSLSAVVVQGRDGASSQTRTTTSRGTTTTRKTPRAKRKSPRSLGVSKHSYSFSAFVYRDFLRIKSCTHIFVISLSDTTRENL